MTGDLFHNCLVDIALVVEICSAHQKDSVDDLPHIRLVHVPPSQHYFRDPTMQRGDHQELEGKL